ncbi:Baeyer-Villiger monooxygenase [Cladobotryum mycophilum]|uniref:Baeyer-Villiger monooxygenase n=1 Tax=Cladobotryum mycophilum TaxID=491253 RepID=A0ABR0T0H6_9HYPO
MSTKTAYALPYRQVIIVGAGIAGLDMACGLKRKLNFDDFVIYERNHALGGTWYDNNYPGCAVDIPGFIYQLSYAPEPNFSRCFPSRAEMNAYLGRVADRFDIHKHVQYNMSWINGIWNEDRKTWTVELQNVNTGETYTQECKVLIGAIGHQVDPKDFEYPENLDLKGKNVVVLGTGSTATQVVPNILKDVKKCTQIQREPHWILNRPNPQVPKSLRAFFSYFPFMFLCLQHLTFAIVEAFYPILGRRISGMAKKHLKQCHVPEKYWPILTPDYTPGCKRIVFSVDYLQCLKDPKVEVVQDTVSSLSENHVITGSGKKYEADIIILCYGFKADTFYYPIQGRNGLVPSEHWEIAGGPSCYKGCAMNGFPNFFSIRGPNVSSGHQSLIWFIEATTALILKVSAPLITGEVDTIEVDPKAEQSYVSRVQAACQRGFWGRDCHTFYVTKDGWNHTVYPWTPYWLWFHRFVNKSHWIIAQRAISKN